MAARFAQVSVRPWDLVLPTRPCGGGARIGIRAHRFMQTAPGVALGRLRPGARTLISCARAQASVVEGTERSFYTPRCCGNRVRLGCPEKGIGCPQQHEWLTGLDRPRGASIAYSNVVCRPWPPSLSLLVFVAPPPGRERRGHEEESPSSARSSASLTCFATAGKLGPELLGRTTRVVIVLYKASVPSALRHRFLQWGAAGCQCCLVGLCPLVAEHV